MSLWLPAVYHWSPTANRKKIRRHGLKPTTATAVWHRPLRLGEKVEHRHEDLEGEQLYGVCFGTTVGTAWAYSGALSAEVGEQWDLWEVYLNDDDEVHVRPNFGIGLDEIRVIGRIPPKRIWLVGSRVRGRLHMGHA